MSLLATSSFAVDTQNYFPSAYRGVSEEDSVMTSATTPQSVPVEYGTKGITTYITSTTPSATVNIQKRNSKGVVLASETVTVGGGISRTDLPPIPFYDIKVSPTGGLTGTNTLHINIQQAK